MKAETPVKRANEDFVIMAEYRLLNAVIQSPAFLQDSRVHDNVFPHLVARSIYQAINDLTAQNVNINPASVFQRANEIDFNVSIDTVNQVFSVPTTQIDKIDDILKVLNKAKQKGEIIEQLNSALFLANNKGDIDAAGLAAKLYEVEQTLASTFDKQILQDFDTWFEAYLEDLGLRAEGRRYPFGDEILDGALVKGAYPGAITTVAASTGQGKSTYVLNLINGMINLNIPCMYISLEMSGIDTMDRLVSLRCEIPTGDLYQPGDALNAIKDIVETERKKLTEESRLFYFVDQPSLSLAQVHALIKEFKQRTKTNYCIVAIDLATQLIDFMKSGPGMNLANAIEMAMNHQSAIAKLENVHFIDVVQFNRDADNLKIEEFDDVWGLRPILGNIKNANAIAERSRAVLGLFRPKYYLDRYLPEDEQAANYPDIMEVQVLKQSNGHLPRLKYMCDMEIFRMLPYVETSETQIITTEQEEAAKHIGSF